MDFISFFVVLIMSYFGKWRLDGYLCQRLLYVEDEKGKDFNGEEFKTLMEKVERNKINFKRHLNLNEKSKVGNIDNAIDKIKEKNNESKNFIENKSSKELGNFKNFEIENNNINYDKNKSQYYSNLQQENNINNPLELSRRLEMSNIGFIKKDNNQEDINKNEPSSNRKIIPENEKLDNQEIQNYLEISINKFWSMKNTLEFKLRDLFIYKCFPKKNIELRGNYDIIKSYSEKIYEKFDIFYYMKELKKSEFMQNILFEEKQKHLIETMSQKLYRVWLMKNYKEEILDLKENNLQSLKYLLEANKNDIDDAEKKIINNFLN